MTKLKFENKTYELTQNAYIDGTNEKPFYVALAKDENGIEHRVYWDINYNDDGTLPEEEDNRCDWENPSKIEYV